MLLDIILVILLVLAAIKGYQRGLIVGLFSFIAIIIGLAAAMKLSAVVAGYIGSAIKVSDQWLPVISFAVIFIIVVLLVRLGANMLQRSTEAIMLGWVNRLGGVVFYAAIYIIVFSVVLFYAEQVRLVQPATTESSVTYHLVQPWGPRAINGFGAIIPVFKDMFAELESFFDGIAGHIPPHQS
ncbi:MAG TPA: CvpA family protein [Chitinophagaceae bacterium]|nr:CvpA family protein [Chitinophagaceae bacterium]